MEAREYLDRLRAVRTYEDKSALLKDLYEKENASREVYAKKRDKKEVVGVEDPFLSMVWVHGEASDLMVYQNQVRAGPCGCAAVPKSGCRDLSVAAGGFGRPSIACFRVCTPAAARSSRKKSLCPRFSRWAPRARPPARPLSCRKRSSIETSSTCFARAC